MRVVVIIWDKNGFEEVSVFGPFSSLVAADDFLEMEIFYGVPLDKIKSRWIRTSVIP